MNQFFNAQKQKQKMTHLPRGDLVFSPPLICFHQKFRGGKWKWMGHTCTCNVLRCDWSQWARVSDGSPRLGNTSSNSPQTVSSTPPAQGDCTQESPWGRGGGTCQKLKTLVVFLHVTAYLYLLWWQLLKLRYYKAPQVWFLCVILDKSLDFAYIC